MVNELFSLARIRWALVCIGKSVPRPPIGAIHSTQRRALAWAIRENRRQSRRVWLRGVGLA